jgi:hypothetical protein
MRRISTATKVTDKFGLGKHGFTNGNAVSGVPATDMEDVWFDHVQEEIAGVVEGTGGTLDPNNRGQLLAAIQKLLLTAGHGQCRLSVVSSTQIKLSPYNGSNLIINGVPQSVPSAGATISNSGLSANTLYYVYAAYNGAMSIELSTTGHGTLSTGVEVKSTDASRTLVGMIRTNASSQFVDSQTQRFCLNWFNRRALSGNQGFAANRSTTSTTAVEISSSERMEFLCWPDEAVFASSPVSLSQNTSGSIATYLYVDGASVAGNAFSPPSGQIIFASPQVAQSLSEGYHYASVYGIAVSGFTTTWQLSSTVMTMQTRG